MHAQPELLATPGPKLYSVDIGAVRIDAPPSFKPLAAAELDINLRQASGALKVGEKTVRTMTPGEIKAKLTVGSDADKTMKAQYLTEEEERLDNANKKLETLVEKVEQAGGQWLPEQQEAMETIHHRAVLDGLEYFIAATDPASNPSAEAFQNTGFTPQQYHDAAVATRTQLESTTLVVFTSADGRVAETHTLAEWNRILDAEAAKMPDYNQADPLTRYYYRKQAEKQVLATRQDKKMRVLFVSAGDKPATHGIAEKANMPEYERVTMDTAKLVLHEILAAHDHPEIDLDNAQLFAEALNSVQGDMVLASLGQFYLAALRQDVDPLHRRFLLLGIRQQLNNLSKYQTSIYDNVRPELIKYLKNTAVSEEMLVIKKEFMGHVVKTVVAQAGIEQYYPAERVDENFDQAYTDFLAAAIFKKRGITPADVEPTLTGLLMDTGISFAEPDRRLIAALMEKDADKLFTGHLKAMGLNLDELGNPQAWAKAHAEELAKATATEAELQKDKAGQIIARRAQAAQKLCDIDIKEVKKHVKRGSMIFFAISGLAIGSMLLQGPLSAGVAMQQSGEEDR